MSENNDNKPVEKTKEQRAEEARLRKERINRSMDSNKSKKKALKAAAPKRNMGKYLYAGGLFIAVLAIMVPAVITAMNNKVEVEKTIIAPNNLTADLGVVVSAKDKGGEVSDEALEVVLYEDFTCVHCKDFEAANSKFLQNLVDQGKITLEYRMVTFLDRGEVGDAAKLTSAAFCTRDAGGNQAFQEMHNFIYTLDNVPNNTDLLAAARDFAPDTAKDCVYSNRYGPWLNREANEKFSEIGSTPTMFIDGEEVSDGDMALVQSVLTEKTLNMTALNTDTKKDEKKETTES